MSRRRLVHLSDLHFGRVHPPTLAPLRDEIWRLEPDLVVISGDLTQRARTDEFLEARSFLDELPQPQLVLPGNHDVPLYNLYHRFAETFTKYQRHITEDLQPVYVDEHLAVIGVNTARAWTWKNGRVNHQQMQEVGHLLCGLGSDVTKVVVTHHPFDLPAGHSEADLVGRARLAMEHFADCGADILLAGHLHVHHIGTTAMRYPLRGRAALVVQAGTATSSRGRGEPNSFNSITIDGPRLHIERWNWDHDRQGFYCKEEEWFDRSPHGWQKAS